MKFTKEEISLCKQVAEKHKKEIKFGGWYLNQADEKDFPQLCTFVQNTNVTGVVNEYIIPLWTISDCLSWLREKGFRYNLEDYRVLNLDSSELVQIIISGGMKKYCRKNFEGKTPLEACLKAVLAVLEEGK